MTVYRVILKYLFGFVTITINGLNKERFINLCNRREIYIWNMKYINDSFTYDISVSDFRKLMMPMRKARVHLRINKRHGLPFFLHKKRKHKAFIPALLLFFIVLYTMSNFVWNISLEGGYTYTEKEIIEFLKENSICHGIKKSKVNCEEIERMIRNEYFDITWVSAELNGTKLTIHIKENFNDIKDTVSKENPCDLTAARDCIIKSIITRQGTPLKKAGDRVKSGEIIVSGIVEILDDNKEVMSTHQVHADADVIGEVKYFYNKSFSLEYEEKEYTGYEKTAGYVRIFGKQISFRQRKASDKYDIIKFENQLHIFENFYLPIYWGKSTAKKYNKVKHTYSNEEAIKKAEVNLENFFIKMKEKGIQIIANDVKIDVDNGSCDAKGYITVIEPIIIDSPIATEGIND